MLFDLAIVGGGPAGCAAAITAARRGASVLLLDRARFPRHKVCGEFVSGESLELLERLLTSGSASLLAQAPRISRARIFFEDSVLSAKINPPASSITRFDLDFALWNACISAGIEARSETNIRTIGGTGPFKLLTDSETFESKAIINATGRWSNLTNPGLRARNTGEKWLGIKAHFHEASPSTSVDLYFFDGGYCGVQPIATADNGSVTGINVCAMVRAEIATTIEDVFRQHPALEVRSQLWTAITEAVSTSPLIFHEPEPVRDMMLQVGDSATFVDPFIGDGISLALRSGALAAQCLTAFFHRDRSLEDVTTNYRREYQKQLAHVARTSSKVRQLLRWPKMVRKPVLNVLAKTPFITNQIVRLTR